MRVLVVDGANVVGSRPDGWWHDRAGAARRLQQRLVAATLSYDEVVLVLEGAAKRGGPARQQGSVRTVHAAGSGDDAIVDEVSRQVGDDGHAVTVVTADRGLRERVQAAGGTTTGPEWLLTQLSP
ncbi:NYN domain-containing protein [Ornithinicoccus halotolerans]|uniref:NYN domain-containing protein n=1 Tax=Ornithinicoccus halotolerans TaxID=1748220 RepID=UPI001295B396|nr:NYN domain-containing protein [Ornithinicoccus halotolerans]